MICIKLVPLCKLDLVAASRSYTCAQDGVDTVQLALVVIYIYIYVMLTLRWYNNTNIYILAVQAKYYV